MAVWLNLLELAACSYTLYAFGPELSGDGVAAEGAMAVPAFLSGHERGHGHAQPNATAEECMIDPSEAFGHSVGMLNWLYLQIAFACVHLLFAPYLQCRLWSKLTEKATEVNSAELDSEEVRAAFRQVFLYDIGVCLYFFIWVASGAWSWMGWSWAVDNPGCNPGGWPRWAASLGYFFFVFVVLYAAGWWTYVHCMSEGKGLVLWTMGAVNSATGYQQPEPAAQRRDMPVKEATPPPQSRMGGLMAGLTGGSEAGKSSGATTAVSTRPDEHMEVTDIQTKRANEHTCLAGMQRACRPKQLAKLVACMGIDLMGDATYFLPALGEAGDAAWAPAAAIALQMMFNANALSFLGLAEELMPFSDWIPTACTAWFLETFLPYHPVSQCIGLGTDK